MLEPAPPSAVKVFAKYVNHLHVSKFMNIPKNWQGKGDGLSGKITEIKVEF